jgi:hypothetical protein
VYIMWSVWLSGSCLLLSHALKPAPGKMQGERVEDDDIANNIKLSPLPTSSQLPRINILFLIRVPLHASQTMHVVI